MRRAGWGRGVLAAIGVAALVSLGLTGCGGDSGTAATDNSNAAKYGTKSNPITLTVSLFGDFGYQNLYKKYEKLHPYIDIKESQAQYATHHSNLQAHLVAGAGAADIEAVDSGFIAQFVAESDKFANMYDYGVDKSEWSPAKVAAASTADGKTLIGLGTDVGGLAICYRTDFMAKAGLPTDSDSVGKLWSTWQDYIDVGKRFEKKEPGVKWFDTASNMYDAIVHQASTGYYNAKTGKMVAATNPTVKDAWNLAVQAIQDNESAALAQNTSPWNTGFAKGSFATTICPAWQMANIQTAAANSAGKWGVATVPGVKGNNGGSYLTVPKQGKNIPAAVALAKWLTSPDQQVAVYHQLGNFPSAVSTWHNPDVENFKKDFFGDSPIGKIYIKSLEGLPAQYMGPHSGDVQQAAGNALNSVEQGRTSPSKAWQTFLNNIKQYETS
jgi:cellobiose transport system substrate-binding protein